jgi:hypothetical protein
MSLSWDTSIRPTQFFAWRINRLNEDNYIMIFQWSTLPWYSVVLPVIGDVSLTSRTQFGGDMFQSQPGFRLSIWRFFLISQSLHKNTKKIPWDNTAKLPSKFLFNLHSWSYPHPVLSRMPKIQSFFFFFFHWHYSPLWALACRTISFHFSLSVTNSLRHL